MAANEFAGLIEAILAAAEAGRLSVEAQIDIPELLVRALRIADNEV